MEPARKGYAGTMFLYKNSLKPVVSFPKIGAPDTMDFEGRIITLEFNDFYLTQVYTPNAVSYTHLSPSPFKNLWSLAIEGQFYIIWPFILIIGLKICKNKVKFANVVLIAAISSAVLMGILYQPGFDPSRVYYLSLIHICKLLS